MVGLLLLSFYIKQVKEKIMAHFAQIENNLVTQVIVVDNNDIIDEQGNELESVGIQFCTDLLGGTWVQTSYNGNMRKNYAGIGDTYDSTRDAFIPPTPFPSWVFDETTFQWDAPVPYPEDGGKYEWDEATTSWLLREK
jgi:hypothetical protein